MEHAQLSGVDVRVVKADVVFFLTSSRLGFRDPHLSLFPQISPASAGLFLDYAELPSFVPREGGRVGETAN